MIRPMIRRLTAPALLLLLLLGLGLAEAGLRWGAGLGDPPLVQLDATVEYRLIPSRTYHRFGNQIAINAHGMRGREHPPEATTNERRVMLIGDSVVYGNHWIDQSDTIGAQLTTQLAMAPPLSRCTVVVMPAAASSWGPVNQAAFLADVGLLDADLGAIIVSSHDLLDTPRPVTEVIPYRLRPSFGALDDAAQIIRERVARRIAPSPAPQAPRQRQRQSLAALDAIHAQFQAAGVPLHLVFHPTVTERDQGHHPAHAIFVAWAESRSVAFHDLGDLPLTEAGYRDTIHPNAIGAAQIALGLAQWGAPALAPCV